MITRFTMSDIPQAIVQLAAQYRWPISLVLLLVATVIYLSRQKIKHGWLNFKTGRRLKRLGNKQISGFQCPDGLGHYFLIDRLILRPDGISLLLFKCYPGKIFCADQIDDWTQMLGKKSYRFTNPLYDLECQVKAVSACVPGVPVNGYLFFDHLAEFPKGHPDRVIHINNIPPQLERDKKRTVDAAVMAGWKKLQLMLKQQH
jgi:hypothetical protein